MVKTNSFACKNCGTQIYLDDERLSLGGKRIPLEEATDSPHQCAGKQQGGGDLELTIRIATLEMNMQNIMRDMENITRELKELGGSVPLNRLIRLEQEVAGLKMKGLISHD